MEAPLEGRPKRGQSPSALGLDKGTVPFSARPLVCAVILNTNRREDTLACVQSVWQNEYRPIAIIVLDNRSSDGSVEAIRGAYPNVQILELSQNFGYAGNNDVGLEAALRTPAEWVFVLNEDTVLDAHCVGRLMAEAQRDPRIGIVGPMVYHFDQPDVIQSAGGVLGTHWESRHLGRHEVDRGQFRAPRPVQWISGCAILIRRGVIEEIGMFDAEYFIYWEETEWCVRAARAGWKIVHVPAAKVWHKGAQRDDQFDPSVTYYSTRNQLRTLAKLHAPLGVWLHTWVRILRTLGSWSIRPRWKEKRAHRQAMWMGVRDFLRRRSGQMPSLS